MSCEQPGYHQVGDEIEFEMSALSKKLCLSFSFKIEIKLIVKANMCIVFK